MKHKPTICFFSACFYPHLGGVERYTFQLSKKLIDQGFNVIVITTNTNGVDEHEISEGITIYRLPIFEKLGDRYPILRLNKKYFQILKAIQHTHIDYFVINTRFYLTSLLGLYLAKKKSKKAIVIEHGTGHFTVNNKVLDFFGRRYEHFITLIVKCYKPKFYGVSNACNNWLQHFSISASGILYNGIDTHYMIKNDVDIKKKYGLPDKALIVSYAGRFIEEKGILTLIEAIKKILQNQKGIYFFLAGSGPLYDFVEDFSNTEQRVFLMGKMEFDNLMNLLKYSNVFVNPSNYPEGLPTTVLEAGANSCGVVATAKGGTSEVIIDSDHGIIIPSVDSEAIVDAITLLNTDPIYLNLISKNLKNRILEKFDWNYLASNFVKILISKS